MIENMWVKVYRRITSPNLMPRKHVGDRKDYYIAETDFWKIAKGILKEREKNEFHLALRTVSESLEMVNNASLNPSESKLAEFYKEQMKEMKYFFDSFDNLVATIIALDELRLGTINKLFGRSTEP